MRPRFTAALGLVLALSCKSRSDTPDPPAAGSAVATPAPPATSVAAGTPQAATPAASAAAATPEAPEGPERAFTTRISRCGWGVVDLSAGDAASPWLIALVDVEAAHELKAPRVLVTELYVGEDPITRGAGEVSLLRQESGSAFSFSAAGTRAVDAALPAGHSRLRIAVQVTGTMKDLRPRKPTRCRVVMTSDDGDNVAAEGELEPPWEMQQ